jgi:hypothetical protein
MSDFNTADCISIVEAMCKHAEEKKKLIYCSYFKRAYQPYEALQMYKTNSDKWGYLVLIDPIDWVEHLKSNFRQSERKRLEQISDFKNTISKDLIDLNSSVEKVLNYLKEDSDE